MTSLSSNPVTADELRDECTSEEEEGGNNENERFLVIESESFTLIRVYTGRDHASWPEMLPRTLPGRLNGSGDESGGP